MMVTEFLRGMDMVENTIEMLFHCRTCAVKYHVAARDLGRRERGQDEPFINTGC